MRAARARCSTAVREHMQMRASRRAARTARLEPSRQPTARCRFQSTSCNHFVKSGPASPPPPLLPCAAKPFRLAVKDNIATAEFPTQCASRILRGHRSPYEATIVTQLRARGGVVVGKTNMDEFGMGSHSTNSMHGAVSNHLSADEPISAGGSSGGSAVAVMLGDADIALGTDTGGSVRLPAAYTGAVGYRPSYGMISRHGVVAYANSLDTVGMLAREVRPILDLLVQGELDREHDPNDPTSLSAASRQRCARACPPALDDMSRLTVGIPLEYNVSELDPLMRRAWVEAATALGSAGVDVVPVSLPSTKEALCAYYVLAPAEASSNLARYDGVRYGARGDHGDADRGTLYSETRGAGFGPEVKRRILLGTYSLSSDAMDNYFIQAQKVRRLVRRDFDRVFRRRCPLYAAAQFDLCDMPAGTALQDKQGPPQVDFLLSPTATSPAPTLDDVLAKSSLDAYMGDLFTVPASLAGLPAVSVPWRVPESRLPLGLQLVGQYWDDRRLLAMAERLKALVA
ncbi:glutamyl-tRNA amidotransferase, A subunit [Metarhizium album ARSEF 1941]|uniref:Glutamyl-tRNA(Gln) amidotransferase subunit A, mitochondrial n=1 Tax=Metarhizium album (strain ARSEF 1941) TaxID=1081103 RepID=A0A0B2X4M3_METAS|nr:glutamyl-tRNA amidotransferase, A subunit [Metarhizium album ARSEF 1941]KHO01284.1 glutamyl-tRNA amidotransferase, A subunit [Metarhizium album ARSEF 1941]